MHLRLEQTLYNKFIIFNIISQRNFAFLISKVHLDLAREMRNPGDQKCFGTMYVLYSNPIVSLMQYNYYTLFQIKRSLLKNTKTALISDAVVPFLG